MRGLGQHYRLRSLLGGVFRDCLGYDGFGYSDPGSIGSGLLEGRLLSLDGGVDRLFNRGGGGVGCLHQIFVHLRLPSDWGAKRSTDISTCIRVIHSARDLDDAPGRSAPLGSEPDATISEPRLRQAAETGSMAI